MGGPGNQFYQYAFARKMSWILQTELKLDLDYNRTISDRDYGVSYVLDKYNTIQNIAGQEECEMIKSESGDDYLLRKIKKSNGFIAKVFRKLVKAFPEYYYLSSSHIKDVFHENNINILSRITGNAYLDGYWGKFKYFHEFYNKIRKELKIREEFKTPGYFKYSDLITNTKNSVSLHFRRGPYESVPEVNVYFGLITLDYYYKAIDWIKNRISGKLNLFVFSNDLQWVKNNLNTDHHITYVDCGVDYIENELMSLCKHNIIANSTFSWWAAYLNNNPDKIVIAPEKWYVDKAAQKAYEKGNMLPETWVKL